MNHCDIPIILEQVQAHAAFLLLHFLFNNLKNPDKDFNLWRHEPKVATALLRQKKTHTKYDKCNANGPFFIILVAVVKILPPKNLCFLK